MVAGKALAVLKPVGPWVPVDRDDVFHTAAVLPEAAWREYFYVNTTSSDRLVRGLSLDCRPRVLLTASDASGSLDILKLQRPRYRP